jgi:hypothetical protein
MDYQTGIAPAACPNDSRAEAGCTETENALNEADRTILPQHRRLPPSPTRSLGGYFDYAGWADQERFVELDRILRSKADECDGSKEQADSEDVDHDGSKWDEHRSLVSCTLIVSGVEKSVSPEAAWAVSETKS